MKKILTISLIAFTAVSTANAQIASKDYVDGKDTAMGQRVGAVETLVGNTAVATQIANAVKTETDAREAADNTITTKIGQIPQGATATTIVGYIDEKATAAQNATTYSADGATVTLTGNQFSATTGNIVENGTGLATTGTIYTAIENAKSDAATVAQGKVDALASGQVATNTGNIATLQGTASTPGSVAKAEADAKAYADTLNTAMNTRMGTAESDISGLKAADTTINNKIGGALPAGEENIISYIGNVASNATSGTTTAINALDVAEITAANGFIKSVSETDGKISATTAQITNNDVAGNAAIDMSKIALPNSASENGVYVLTANALNGTVTYSWEEITDRSSGGTQN